MTVAWAQVAPGEVVVANAERAWLHRPDMHSPFAQPMTGPTDEATTAHLLDGAIAAGQRAGLASVTAPPPPLTLPRWAWRLAGYYHLTTHTPSLLRHAGQRFAAAGQTALADWATEKAREEAGHDRLALRDLEALGLPAAKVVEVWQPPMALAMVARFRAEAHAPGSPLGVVGYAHTVERLAMALGADYIASVRAVLPRGVDATRCLRVHSATGSDASHVDDNISLIASQPAALRSQIAIVCREVAQLFSTPPGMGRPSDAELGGQMAGWGASVTRM